MPGQQRLDGFGQSHGFAMRHLGVQRDPAVGLRPNNHGGNRIEQIGPACARDGIGQLCPAEARSDFAGSGHIRRDGLIAAARQNEMQ